MNPETGEIKNFPKFIPVGWEGLPQVDDEVEVVAPPRKRRARCGGLLRSKPDSRAAWFWSP